MFNFKVGGIAAGTAFVLSFLIGIVRGNGFFVLSFRAFLFGAIFFGISCLVCWLAAQFLPELLNEGEDDLGLMPGSRVDITEGPIVGAFPQDTSEEVDDIAGSPSARVQTQPASLPLDRDGDTGYNGKGVSLSMEGLAGPENGFEAAGSGLEGAGFPGGAVSVAEVLPDMDGGLAEVSEGVAGADLGFETPEPRRSAGSSRKPPSMAGDFNPKELAQAIQTVLQKDEKG